jgi:dTDP-4-dehydrorhamnose reductase
MDKQARILVLGRGGWLGSSVWGLLATRPAIAQGPRSSELDIRNPKRVNEALDAFQPTAVLNLAAARPSAAEDDLQGLNVHAAGFVAEACARRGTRLIHVSTDALLDGYDAPYADDAPATPLTRYGRSKAAGEVAVLEAHPGALCVRTSLI